MMRYKITIEDREGTGKPAVFEFEKLKASWRQGIHRSYKPGSYTVDMGSNGQFTLLVEAWTGCASYQAFQETTETSSEELMARAKRLLGGD
jgi:hypothetical protein